MTARSEIETKLKDWANSQLPPIPVALQGKKFIVPVGPYLRLTMLASTPINRNLSGEEQRVFGMFQIDCYAPMNNGMGDVERLAESICDLFPVIPKTGTVSIEKPLSWNGSYEEDSHVCIPVRASYRIET